LSFWVWLIWYKVPSIFLKMTWFHWTYVYVCFETQSHYITQAELEFTILLPLRLKYWDYRHALPKPTENVQY
jgi:hypothetical protein